MNKKLLGSIEDIQATKSKRFMRKLNQFAHESGLKEYKTYSRMWEFPWVWFQLEPLKGKGLTIVDIGSEKSPIGWFLSKHGFKVLISDFTAEYWRVWGKIERRLKVDIKKGILDAQSISLPTSSVDIYLSISVIEHVENKKKAIEEAARIVRPGGLLVMTFDICEPEMGMTFPEWNGCALTMQEFDKLFLDSFWFESVVSETPWNKDVIPAYLSWHQSTAPHHNYVTGAAVIERNGLIWKESSWKNHFRTFKGATHTTFLLVCVYMSVFYNYFFRTIAKYLNFFKQIKRRLALEPLEFFPDVPDLFQIYRHLHKADDSERKPGGWLYQNQFYPDYLTVGGASHAIKKEALKFCIGEGIDIGAGYWPLPGAIPVDTFRGTGLTKKLIDFKKESLDFVFSSHCLEHIENWQEALFEWASKLKPSGIIFLYLPHPDCAIWHPGSPFVGDGHKWIPTQELVKKELTKLKCETIQYDNGPDAMASFYICAKKITL